MTDRGWGWGVTCSRVRALVKQITTLQSRRRSKCCTVARARALHHRNPTVLTCTVLEPLMCPCSGILNVNVFTCKCLPAPRRVAARILSETGCRLLIVALLAKTTHGDSVFTDSFGELSAPGCGHSRPTDHTVAQCCDRC